MKGRDDLSLMEVIAEGVKILYLMLIIKPADKLQNNRVIDTTIYNSNTAKYKISPTSYLPKDFVQTTIRRKPQ